MASYKDVLLRKNTEQDLKSATKFSVIQEFAPGVRQAMVLQMHALSLQKPKVDCYEEKDHEKEEDCKDAEDEDFEAWGGKKEEDDDGKGEGEEDEDQDQDEGEGEYDEDDDEGLRTRKGGRYRCPREHIDWPRAAYRGRRA